jgi:hypothetical protein
VMRWPRTVTQRLAVSGCIPYLAVGDSDKLILPDEAELGTHRLRARKSSYWIKQVLNGGKSEFMTFDVRPGSVLRAAERVLRSNLMNAPLRGEVS